MKEGLYRIEKILSNRALFENNDTQEGNTVRISKAPYTDTCVICGKKTYWTLSDEYEFPIGCDCLKTPLPLRLQAQDRQLCFLA